MFEYVDPPLGDEYCGLRHKGIHEYRLDVLLFKTVGVRHIILRETVDTVSFSQYTAEQALGAFERLKTDRPSGYLTAKGGLVSSASYYGSALKNKDNLFCVLEMNDASHACRINSPVAGAGSYLSVACFYLEQDSILTEEPGDLCMNNIYCRDS